MSILNIKDSTQMTLESPTVYCKNYLPLLESAAIMLYANGGVGKALRNTEQVLTPEGFKEIQSLTVGDYVIGSNGKPTKVVGVYPQGRRQLYRISFIDGTYIDADEDHLWSVYDGKKADRNKLLVKKTTDLLNGFSRTKFDKRYGTYTTEYFYSIPLHDEAHFGKKPESKLDPYLLGLYLGDGGSTQGSTTITNGNARIVREIALRCSKEDTITTYHAKNTICSKFKRKHRKHHCPSEMTNQLKELGLLRKKSIDKFIPDQFKYGDVETRKEVLRGLIDTDGYVVDGKLKEYSTSSKQLAEDFLFIGRSLGMLLTIKERLPRYRHKGKNLIGKKSYRIYQKQQTRKTITGIEKIDIDEATCISVEAKDNLFIANGFNLTHNSFLSTQVACRFVEESKEKAALWLTEDAEGETNQRYRRVIKDRKSDLSFMNEHVKFIQNEPIRFTKLEGNNAVLTDEFKEIKEDLKPYKLVVIDPLLQFNGGDENSNTHAGVLMGALKSWAAEDKKIILLIHHASYNDKTGSIKGRGAGEWVNGTRGAYAVEKVPNITEIAIQTGYPTDQLLKIVLTKDNGLSMSMRGDDRNERGQPFRLLKVFPKWL